VFNRCLSDYLVIIWHTPNTLILIRYEMYQWTVVIMTVDFDITLIANCPCSFQGDTISPKTVELYHYAYQRMITKLKDLSLL
jgi:hypothetical protein